MKYITGNKKQLKCKVLFGCLNVLLIGLIMFFSSCSKSISVRIIGDENPTITYGVSKLKAALENAGYDVLMVEGTSEPQGRSIIIESLINDNGSLSSSEKDSLGSKESYLIKASNKDLTVYGADANGVLYAILDLANRVSASGSLPQNIYVFNKPEMLMRGTCVGLQKTNILPGRHVYEYPYSPENFPWFYDKELWIKYLDLMVENQFNTLYLWNGHPFASLVKLKDYPEALEVDEDTFKKNEEIYRFLTLEAEKRGICIIQMFYNIILSKPFAEKHGLKTQDRSRGITPLIEDYTRKSITAFMEKYPNVGLLVTLGEAMNTIEDDVNWFTKTILPAVKDGIKKYGEGYEPPIVLRGHDTDAKRVMNAALPVYKNLYTMYKYNGESLTTYEPRNDWATIPHGLSDLGSLHISNVHILANLEPFRYASPDFIQKSVKAMEHIQGAKGLHLYPQASYWDWPYAADHTNPRLLQIDRDWMWYKAWGRYAWNSKRSRSDEVIYWSGILNSYYGCDKGADILKAYEETGEIAPKLLRTFGISDGNRQTLLLGMFMGQFVNPFKYSVYQSFLNSNGPESEILIDYAQKEWNDEVHNGETPPQIIEEVVKHADEAVKAIESAALAVDHNNEEFERLKNDIYCYRDIAYFFNYKVKAAMLVLRYKYSNNIEDLQKAVPLLDKSLDHYRDLVGKTENKYLYANSMQTSMRRIPIEGKGGMNKTWRELLPQYEKEAEVFKRNIDMLRENGGKRNDKEPEVLKAATVKVYSEHSGWFSMNAGQKVYNDNVAKIKAVAPELNKLKGLRFSDKQQQENGTELDFSCDQPVKILVGYFNTNSYTVLRPPTLETNAHANDHGEADIKIANALDVPGLYPVNVYTYTYPAGRHQLKLGKGRVLILGFMDGNKNIPIHDAGIGVEEGEASVDWLFY